MDFLTKPTKREYLRALAKAFKKILGYTDLYYMDVIDLLEKMPILFQNVFVEIVPQSDPDVSKVPGTVIPKNGDYIIKIRESIYDGAYYRCIGGYRMHIMHEICHVLLFMLGHQPKYDRAFKNESLNPYESIEWQAKALAGEFLIPYEETKGISVKQIMEVCKVSKQAAQFRVNLDLNNKEEKQYEK